MDHVAAVEGRLIGLPALTENLMEGVCVLAMQVAEISPDARAVAGLGLSLGITTLVEGAETQQPFDLARAEGVDQVQGYLFSRQQPKAAVSEMIARKHCPGSAG